MCADKMEKGVADILRESAFVCCICLEVKKEHVGPTTCTHHFCRKCMKSVIKEKKRKASCPLCQKPITKYTKRKPVKTTRDASEEIGVLVGEPNFFISDSDFRWKECLKHLNKYDEFGLKTWKFVLNHIVSAIFLGLPKSSAFLPLLGLDSMGYQRFKGTEFIRDISVAGESEEFSAELFRMKKSGIHWMKNEACESISVFPWSDYPSVTEDGEIVCAEAFKNVLRTPLQEWTDTIRRVSPLLKKGQKSVRIALAPQFPVRLTVDGDTDVIVTQEQALFLLTLEEMVMSEDGRVGISVLSEAFVHVGELINSLRPLVATDDDVVTYDTSKVAEIRVRSMYCFIESWWVFRVFGSDRLCKPNEYRFHCLKNCVWTVSKTMRSFSPRKLARECQRLSLKRYDTDTILGVMNEMKDEGRFVAVSEDKWCIVF